MKTYSLVYTVVAAVVLSACGGTNQNPLAKYPKVAELQPKETIITPREMPKEYVDRIVTRVDEKIVYKDREVKVEVPTYINRNIPNTLFVVTTPTNQSRQIKFVVGQKVQIPVRIRAAVGQMKYDVSVESSVLRNLKLENTKVEGNETVADLTYTAAQADIPAGETVGLGEFSFKMSIRELKHNDADLEKAYNEIAKANNNVVKDTYYLVVLPGGTPVTQTKVSETPAAGDAQ